MRRSLAALGVIVAAAAATVAVGAAPASAASCASTSTTAGTLTVTNVCGPYHSWKYFTPHVHINGHATTLGCKGILANASATWSKTAGTSVDSVSYSTSGC